jgi:hypothetical protein
MLGLRRKLDLQVIHAVDVNHPLIHQREEHSASTLMANDAGAVGTAKIASQSDPTGGDQRRA